MGRRISIPDTRPRDREPWGFYEVLHKDNTIAEADEARKRIVRKAHQVCDITGADWGRGQLIVKLIPPGDKIPELVLTVGWKIDLTQEQYRKIEEAGL